FGETFANRENAGDRRGADGAEANKKNAEFSAGLDDFNRCRHEQKLYIIPSVLLNPFKRSGDDPHALLVGMTGVKLGDRFVQIGCANGARLAAVAAKVGLSGRAVAVVPDQESAARAQKGASDAGVLVEVETASPRMLPLDADAFDFAVVD